MKVFRMLEKLDTNSMHLGIIYFICDCVDGVLL